MSYQGGHDGYSVDWQSHDHQYASPNQNPQQVMTNSSSQPAAYYSPRLPSVSQPQMAQPWLGNGNNNHPQYAPQNGYPFNQAYPTMPMAQPQQFQPQYSQPLPQQQQQQRMPQPQSHHRPQQNPTYSEHQYKRVQHQSPHMNQPIARSPQTSYRQQPHQHVPQKYHHIEQTSRQVPMNPSYTEQRPRPIHQSYSADPSQRTTHPHTSQSTISPSDVVLQSRQQPTKPSALSSHSPNQRTTSPSHLTPQSLDRLTISPSNLGTNSGPNKPPMINPSNLSTNSGTSKPPTIIPSNTITRFPEARTISPSNLLSQPAEQHTVKPSNLMSPHNETLTISPSNLLSRPTEQYTVSPSNVMSPYVEPRTISPSSLLSRPPEQPTIIPPNLLTKAAPVPSHKSQIDQPLLLIALAEEYFETAHSLAPSVALAMDENSVEHYNKLIATGLGCLEAAMKKVKLPPRLEANVTLRFAGVLYDEDTDNFMDAELILSKGIATCDRNHYYDLKYAMQFLLAQFMFKKNYKAAMKALDSYIADAEAYQHYSWIYALRFLRATHAMTSGNIAESHACLQNLRSISNIASKQDDHAIFQMASLMEAITHLKSSGPESIENVQRAIAAASTYQLDEDSKLPQLIGLTHILDVACSIRRGNPADMRKKLQAMQLMMDDALSDPRWSKTSDTISIPINRPRKESHTVSRDTRTILGIGDDGRDNLIVSFLSMRDAYAITYLLCGLILLHDLTDRKASVSESKASTTHKAETERKGFRYLREGLSKLASDTRSVKNSSGLLPNLVQKLNWRGQILCYFHLYMAFGMAAIANWSGVKKSIDEARFTAEKMQVSLEGPLGYLIPYLEGVYHQGLGNLDTAIKIFQNERFTLSSMKSSNPSSVDQLEHDITILAALNALSILREGTRQDITVNTALIQRLEPLCIKHPNVDIQTAFHISAATLKTNPPAPGFQARNHLRESMHGAQRQANKQFVCITLNMMCSTFFQNIVGEQAEKSAKAAVVHAREGGNPLWISVADGLISHFYDIQGNKREAQAAFEEGRVMAERAVPNS